MDDDLLPAVVYEQLQKADWGALAKRLFSYAYFRLRQVNYPRPTAAPAGQGFDPPEVEAERRNARTELALGQTIEDLIHTVIEKTYSGERRWDPNKGDLEHWLMQQVNSEMDHLYKSWDFRNSQSLESEDENNAAVEHDETQIQERNSRKIPQPPRTVEIEAEEKLDAQKAVGRLFEISDEDPELQAIMEAILGGCEPKPAALAEEMGLPVTEVYRRLRNLRRRALK